MSHSARTCLREFSVGVWFPLSSFPAKHVLWFVHELSVLGIAFYNPQLSNLGLAFQVSLLNTTFQFVFVSLQLILL